MRRVAREGPIKQEKTRGGAVGQCSLIYSSIHSETFLQHLGDGRKGGRHSGGHRDE